MFFISFFGGADPMRSRCDDLFCLATRGGVVAMTFFLCVFVFFGAAPWRSHHNDRFVLCLVLALTRGGVVVILLFSFLAPRRGGVVTVTPPRASAKTQLKHRQFVVFCFAWRCPWSGAKKKKTHPKTKALR